MPPDLLKRHRLAKKMNYNWSDDYPLLFELYQEAKQRGLNNFFQELAGKINETPDFDV